MTCRMRRSIGFTGTPIEKTVSERWRAAWGRCRSDEAISAVGFPPVRATRPGFSPPFGSARPRPRQGLTRLPLGFAGDGRSQRGLSLRFSSSNSLIRILRFRIGLRSHQEVAGPDFGTSTNEPCPFRTL